MGPLPMGRVRFIEWLRFVRHGDFSAIVVTFAFRFLSHTQLAAAH